MSLLTGHHVADHGILGEHFFSQREEKVVSLRNTSAWESAQSFDTIWVRIDEKTHIFEKYVSNLKYFPGFGEEFPGMQLAICPASGARIRDG